MATARQQQASSGLLLLNPYYAIGLGPELIRTQQTTLDMIERERQQCHQDAEAAVARQAQEARAREQEARDQKREQARGYRRISFETFLLDGKDLATRTAKVSLNGAYTREGNVDVLYPDMRVLIIAHNYQSAGNQQRIPLLIDDASRDFRQRLLMCRSNPASAQIGCPFTVLGQVTICTLSNGLGAERTSPCISVEDGR
jgi:hypothetical protein